MSDAVESAKKAFDKAKADLELANKLQDDVPKNIDETIKRLINYAESGKQDAEWQARKDACMCS